ncbi:MAG: hypothetical protein HZA61_14325 [Candidatus Eisenbacteria bacterium]|uniref:6-bladed beta-propeller n=1 Tax=Eiseniibacteriota bacterium TaxID=2212470 RepID=A0A933SG19_UNCEI|nr:hypothetical protein [Candidatus Eisenbacteria bacterium]
MRRLITLFLLLAATFAAAPRAAHAAIGAPTSWFAPPANVYEVLGHPDGTIWVGCWPGVYRFSRAGTNLGPVANFVCLSMATCPNGDVVALDYVNRTVHRFTSSGAFVRSFALTNVGGDGDATLVTDDANNIYVLFKYNGPNYVLPWIRKYDEFGTQLAETGPIDVAHGLTRIGNTLYAAELYTKKILKFDLNLQPQGFVTVPEPSQYSYTLEADRDGNLLLTDYYSHELRRMTTSGSVLETVLNGFPGWPGYYPFWNPAGTSQAPDGLYIAADPEHGFVLLFGAQVTPARTSTFGAVKAGTR